MKRLILASIATVAGLSATVAQAEQLKLGDWQSLTHIVSVEGTQMWMKSVEEMTGGKITFEHFPAQQAAKSAALLGAAGSGVLDAALVGPIYNSDELPLNSVVSLPGFYKSAVQGTTALQTMMADGPLRDELLAADVVPIFSFVLPPYQILSKDDRMGGPDDWNGLNIRTSGSTQAMVARDLGGAGISIPGPEVYTAVETGRLDGVLFPLASVPAYKLNEVVKHISTNGSFGGYSFVVVVNKDKFESLDQDVQDAMIKAGAEAAMNVAKAQDNSIDALTAEWKADGVDVYAFSDEESAALNSAIAAVQQEWLDRIGKRNPKAAETLAQYTELTK